MRKRKRPISQSTETLKSFEKPRKKNKRSLDKAALITARNISKKNKNIRFR